MSVNWVSIGVVLAAIGVIGFTLHRSSSIVTKEKAARLRIVNAASFLVIVVVNVWSMLGIHAVQQPIDEAQSAIAARYDALQQRIDEQNGDAKGNTQSERAAAVKALRKEFDALRQERSVIQARIDDVRQTRDGNYLLLALAALACPLFVLTNARLLKQK